MFMLVLIMIFALIAVITGKRWAILTATILYISIFVLGFIFGISANLGIPDTDITTGLSGAGVALPDEVFEEPVSTVKDKIETILFLIDNLLIAFGWVRFGLKKNKETKNIEQKETTK